MRCKACKYWHSPAYESDDDCCSLFGYDNDGNYISENSKCELGCRYNSIQLKAFHERAKKELMEGT